MNYIDLWFYHTNLYGTGNNDDLYHDLQIGVVDWNVKRFWAYELHDNMND